MKETCPTQPTSFIYFFPFFNGINSSFFHPSSSSPSSMCWCHSENLLSHFQDLSFLLLSGTCSQFVPTPSLFSPPKWNNKEIWHLPRWENPLRSLVLLQRWTQSVIFLMQPTHSVFLVLLLFLMLFLFLF